jgi:hypothetical protein
MRGRQKQTAGLDLRTAVGGRPTHRRCGRPRCTRPWYSCSAGYYLGEVKLVAVQACLKYASTTCPAIRNLHPVWSVVVITSHSSSTCDTVQGSTGVATGRLASETRASRVEHVSGVRGSSDRAASGAGDSAAPHPGSRASRASHGGHPQNSVAPWCIVHAHRV